MRRSSSSAASLRHRSVVAVIITVVLALVGGTAPAIAAPQQVPLRQQNAANEPPADPVDEEYEFYKMLVTDISEHAEDVEVRDAAKAALAVNTKEKLIWFIDHGQAEAQARANQRKAAENAANREKVKEWARTGGPNVKAGAEAALGSGDRAIRDFVAYGYEIALKKDRQQAEDDKAEQDRIIARVREMVAMGGPEVKVEGEAALATRDYSQIREFYLTGYHAANQRDHQFQAVILKALEDRNKAITELDQLARKFEEAAKARAEIIRTNIDAVQALEDGIGAMHRAVKAAHRADEIFREDKPGRAHGQLGRNGDIDVQRAKATEEAALAARIADRAQEAVNRAHNAAIRLVDTGMTNGRDWAKVTFGIGNAVQAMALAAKTSQHAAEATLADSRALDADRNAQEHAENAKKYLEEARRQEQRAKELADAAQVQHDMALAARDRAKAQKDIAAAKANQARGHAANARNHRVNAQNAATNANGAAQAAINANNNAAKHKIVMDAAVARSEQVAKDWDRAEKIFSHHVTAYNQFQRELEKAKKKAEENGGTAWDEYYAIERETNAAKASADQAEGWASRARESAAAAAAEAAAATRAANEANAAAVSAGKAATEARRAADDTHRLALESTGAAVNARDAAEMVRTEAEAAVAEANEAVYQSVVADRAASAATACAELMIDPASMAEDVLKPLAAINADARRALAAVTEALMIGEEQSRAAREKATEAAAAATRARRIADEAAELVKPAYQAAANAADSAKRAADLAVAANDAANVAAQHANDAAKSAGAAGQWASSAQSDAALAGSAANSATAAASTARAAAESAENIRAWAHDTATRLTAFKDRIADRLATVTDINQRYRAALELAKEAQAKREEMNRQTLEGLEGLAYCTSGHVNQPLCQKVLDWAKRKVGEGLDAATSHAGDWYECVANGNKTACDNFLADARKVIEFNIDVALGFGEAAISPIMSAIEIGKCAYQGASDGDWSKCWDIYNAVKYNLTNPHTWINMEEWQTRPGKALGGTLFDIGVTAATFETGGVGGAAWKAARTLGRKLDGGSGRLSNKLVELESLAVKVNDRVRDVLPNALAEIFSLRGRFDADKSKFDSSIALVDGRLYRVEPFEINVPNAANLPNGSKVRIEGGTLRIENGVAHLDDAKLKVEPPKTCPAGVMMAAAADPPCSPVTDPSEQPKRDTKGAVDEHGTYTQVIDLGHALNEDGRTYSDLGVFEIKATKDDLEWLTENRVKPAREADPLVTPEIQKLAALHHGETVKLDTKLKDQNPINGGNADSPSASTVRKFMEERMPTEVNGPWKKREDVLADMNDSLRYTVVFPQDKYTDSTEEAIKALRVKYGEELKFKNFWQDEKGGDMAGINITFRAPNGLPFEVQFHTKASYTASGDEHRLYDIKRKYRAAKSWTAVKPGLTQDQRDALKDLINAQLDYWGRVSKWFFEEIIPPTRAHEIKGKKKK